MRPVLTFTAALAIFVPPPGQGAEPHPKTTIQFQTSDRCFPCHVMLKTPIGEDVSIGFDWRASIMANSSRDPYWQASVRRETIDHPENKRAIEDECSVCHMPVTRFEARLRHQQGRVFAYLPFDAGTRGSQKAEDGVTCSVCHQIGKEKLGTPESFNGEFVIDAPESKNDHPEYGPFNIEAGQKLIMNSSTAGFLPTEAAHIRDSGLCGTCHTLITKPRDQNGNVIAEFPEQMPYPEWQHSDYRDRQSCQECHMPVVPGEVPITGVLGVPRQGLHRHMFLGANFFMLRLLNRFREDLSVKALPQELVSVADATAQFLETRSARLSIENLDVAAGRLQADVVVENLTGHKLPTAYPSRRAWLRFTVYDRSHKAVFESGHLRPDGSIEGNDNDADPARYEPHYRQITDSSQVQIYEPILGDAGGHITTGLLATVRYLKDSRLLPHGFDKATAAKEIGVYGEAADDPAFTGGGHRIRYSVAVGSAEGPFRVEAELWYQPIGFRWANNLKPYGRAAEPRRFNEYYDATAAGTAIVLARTWRTL